MRVSIGKMIYTINALSNEDSFCYFMDPFLEKNKTSYSQVYFEFS